MGKSMFSNVDGLNTVFSAIYFPPMSYGGPHAHVPGVEELWVKVGTDAGYIILRSEIGKVVGNGAFLSPPNGKTVHSSMNLSEDHPAIWLYIAHRKLQPATPTGRRPLARAALLLASSSRLPENGASRRT
jgi:hypothetical protein